MDCAELGHGGRPQGPSPRGETAISTRGALRRLGGSRMGDRSNQLFHTTHDVPRSAVLDWSFKRGFLTQQVMPANEEPFPCTNSCRHHDEHKLFLKQRSSCKRRPRLSIHTLLRHNQCTVSSQRMKPRKGSHKNRICGVQDVASSARTPLYQGTRDARQGGSAEATIRR